MPHIFWFLKNWVKKIIVWFWAGRCLSLSVQQLFWAERSPCPYKWLLPPEPHFHFWRSHFTGSTITSEYYYNSPAVCYNNNLLLCLYNLWNLIARNENAQRKVSLQISSCVSNSRNWEFTKKICSRLVPYDLVWSCMVP